MKKFMVIESDPIGCGFTKFHTISSHDTKGEAEAALHKFLVDPHRGYSYSIQERIQVPISQEESEARAPLPVDVLLNARQDSVHDKSAGRERVLKIK